MTCIACVRDGSRILVGGDSNVTWNGTNIQSPASKVWRAGPLVFGFAGLAPIQDALQYRARIPKPEEPIGDLRAWVTRHLVRSIRAAVGRAGGPQPELALLVAHGAQAVLVDEAACVVTAGEYTAVGSGMDLALGALYATRHLPAALRIEAALEAAERHCADVRRPWTILSTAPEHP